MDDDEKREVVGEIDRRLMDSRPLEVIIGWPTDTPQGAADAEAILGAIRDLYLAMGGQDMVFTFRDREGRVVANPESGGPITAEPYDDRA